MKTIETSKVAKLEDLIGNASQIAIVAHTREDGDAVGSCTALMHYLRECRHINVGITFADPVPDSISFIIPKTDLKNVFIYSKDSQAANEWVKGSDLLFCMDCNAFSRTDKLQDIYTASKAKKVLIDHHLNPNTEQFDLTFSEIEISSTAELLFYILLELPGIDHDAAKLPAITADSLMAGMTTDTNNFANSTFPSTLNMASQLLAAGVNRDAILSNLYNCYRENRVRIMGHMFQDMMVITKHGVAYMVLDDETIKKYDVQEGETEGFVNIPLSIKKVKMSILLKQDNGFCRVSIRSKKGISANQCAVDYFNGGGHELAAGGKLFYPKDIAQSDMAAGYIEHVTDIFLSNEI